MHRFLACLALCLAAIAGQLAATADESPRAQSNALVREAQGLINAKQFVQAAEKLEAARKLTPEEPDVYINLGYLSEVQGNKEAALAHYGHLLYLNAADTYAPGRIKHLWLSGKFPRSIRLNYLKFAPISAVVDECRFPAAEGKAPLTCRLVYTTSTLFQEDMPENGPPTTVKLPAVAGKEADEANSAKFNRSTYGYVVEPDGDTANLAFILSYPSAMISSKQADYSQLAPRLMHILLRMYWYNQQYLGRPAQVPLVKVWLCDGGPAGAEQLDENIFLYDAATPRTALEWTREMAHEYGHYVLPPMGKFVEPEPYASGELGERLSLQWLADEAGRVADAPWPQDAAINALKNLWGKDELPLQSYIVGKCRPALDLWETEGPQSQLTAGLGVDGMNHFVGFMLWVEAAHGTEVLRQVVTQAAGAAPADFMAAYKATAKGLADQKRLSIAAGAVCLKRSKLTTPPGEGAMRREGVVLAAGDTAAYWVYLPGGAWNALLAPVAREVTVTVDDGNPATYVAGKGAPLGDLAEGWHLIKLSLPAGQANLPLGRIQFVRPTEA